MSADVHIVSLVVHVLPERVSAVVELLAHERDIVALTARLADVRGVLGVNLVHHHIEPAEELDQEIRHAPDPA